MKVYVKYFLYLSGILGLLHRVRNRQTLTVVMLHRVIPKIEQVQQGANQEWTLTDSTFTNFLGFLGKHYKFISIDQLLQAKGQIKKLPKRAILLTFDDGWYDNFKYAFPIISDHSIPAHIFIATDYLNKYQGFWPEQIHSSCSIDPSLEDKLAREVSAELVGKGVQELITFLHQNEPVEENFPQIFKLMKPSLPKNRQMLSEVEIKEMSSKDISFGSHGASHSMMGTLSVQDAEDEICRSTKALNELLEKPTLSLSFPHGHYRKSLLEICHKFGIQHMFTSTASIQSQDSKIHPRIHISEKAITKSGKFNAAKASFALFFRNHI